MTLLEAALQYAEQGHPVFPLAPRTKVPLKDSNGLSDATTDPDRIREMWASEPDANIGVRCDRLAVVDPDVRGGKRGPDQWRGALVENGHEPDEDFGAPVATTPSTGTHNYFALPEGFRAQQRNGWLPGVDIKAGPGAYVLAPPSRTRKGHRTDAGTYVWSSGSIEEVPLAPPWILDAVRADEPRARGEGTEPLPLAGSPDDWETIVDCLSVIKEPYVSDYDDWIRVGQVIRRVQPNLLGLGTWDAWSQNSPKYKPGDCESRWGSLGKDHPNPVGIGTLVRWAELDGAGAHALNRSHGVGDGAQGEQSTHAPKSREELLALVNRAIGNQARGIVFDRVLKIGAEGGSIDILLRDGRRVSIDEAGGLCTPRPLEKALADLGYAAPKLSPKRRRRVAQAILDLVEVVEAETDADELREWLGAARSLHSPLDLDDETTNLDDVTGDGPWVWFRVRGRSYVRLAALQQFVRTRFGASVGHRKLSQRLAGLGYVKKRPAVGRDGRQVEIHGYLEPEEQA